MVRGHTSLAAHLGVGMRLFGLFAVGFALCACTEDHPLRTEDHLFRDPATGQIVKCSGGWQYGLIGMAQQQDQGGCDDRMWQRGFERIPPGVKPEMVAAPKP